jgi:branched-chain amino acid transport system permease protein
MIQILAQLLIFGLSNGAVIALNALGVTLVYSVVRTVNFAYGDVFALCTVVVTQLILGVGLRAGGPLAATAGGLVVALAAAMAFGALLNLGVERAAFRPFRGRSQLGPLIAGIGISFMLFQAAISWRQIAEVGWGNPEHHSDVDNLANVPHYSIPALIPNINLLSLTGLASPVRLMLKDAIVIALALALAVLVGSLLTRTRFGRALQACAQDPAAATLCGVDRGRAISAVFALGGALGGAGAFVFTLYYERPFGQHGAESGLLAFTAAVLGGIGNPLGALAGGLLLGVVASLSDYFLPAQWTPVLVLGILIALLALRPTGLAAESEAEQAREIGADGRAPHEPRRWQAVLTQLYSRAGAWRWAWLPALALALAYPALDGALGIHRVAVVNGMLVFVLLALGLNIVLGMAGMLDLGFAACFAVGGYSAALLLGTRQADFLAVLVVGVAAAALFGALNGLLTLRLRGDYLAVVALAFGQLVPRVVVNLSAWTGGAVGLSALPAPTVLGQTLATQQQRFYLALIMAAVVALLSLRLARSRLGRAWAALSADELAAQSCGISLVQVKPLAFILGAAVAGVAAALSAGIFGYVNPDQSEFRVSAMVLAMVVVGGTGRVGGAVLGALLIGAYDQIVLPQLGDWLDATGSGLQIATLNYLSFGLALYLTVLWRGRRT